MELDLMAIRVLRVVPTLSLFAASIWFAGLALKRRKEKGLLFIFAGMVLLFVSMSSLQLIYRLMEHPELGTPDWFLRFLMQATGWIPVISGLCLVIGWYQFSRKKEADPDGQRPTRGM